MEGARTGISSPRAIISFLIILFIFRTQSLALTPFLSLTSPKNLTDVWSYRHCVSDPSWNPRGLHIASSCENALIALSDDSLTWGPHPGTFIYQPDGRSTAFFPGAPSLLTLPKRYVNGDCVVAIVMMKMFERSSVGQFPGLPDSLIGKWRTRDTISWKGLVEPADYVRATCGNGCGYAVLGREFGIAIAIWGYESKWDQFARQLSLLSKKGDGIPGFGIGNSSFASVGNRSVLDALR